MHHLIYISHAAAPWTGDELVALLAQARSANEHLGVTGMLMYGGRWFAQVLEGEAATVHALYARIKQDPRHAGCVVLADKAIAARSFKDWSMSFTEKPAEEMEQVVGLLAHDRLLLQDLPLNAMDRVLLETVRRFVYPLL